MVDEMVPLGHKLSSYIGTINTVSYSVKRFNGCVAKLGRHLLCRAGKLLDRLPSRHKVLGPPECRLGVGEKLGKPGPQGIREISSRNEHSGQ